MFRILAILSGLSAKFLDMACFINQSLVSLFEAQADYTSWKDVSLKFWQDFYIQGTLFLSSKLSATCFKTSTIRDFITSTCTTLLLPKKPVRQYY